MANNAPWWEQVLSGNIGGGIKDLVTGSNKPIVSGKQLGRLAEWPLGGKSSSSGPPSSGWSATSGYWPEKPPPGVNLSSNINYSKLLEALQADPGSFQDIITVDGKKLTASQVNDPETAAKWISGYLTSKNYATPSFINTSGQTNALTDPIDPSVIASYFKDYATPEVSNAFNQAKSEQSAWQGQEQQSLQQIPSQFRGLFKAITGAQDQSANQTLTDEQAIAGSAPGLQYLMQLFASNTAAKQALQTAVQRYATGATITQPDLSTIQQLAASAASPTGSSSIASPIQNSLLNQLAISQAGLPSGY